MKDYKNPIDRLIAELGGTSAVAGEMGLTPSVVSGWRARGNIPRWRLARVLEIAVNKRVPWPQQDRAA